MQPTLIYDIQSENQSQNAQQQSQDIKPKHSLKSTDISEIHSNVIHVRSQSSDQSPKKLIKVHQQPATQNIIFYDEDLNKSTRSVEFDDTKRGFLQSRQEDSYQEQYQQSQEQELYQIQEKQENQIEIIPPQQHLKDRAVILTANTNLFIKQIVPFNYNLTCYITIERNMLSIPTRYRIFLGEDRQFLMSAKKEVFKYYSHFIISNHPNEVHKRTGIYIGSVKANFVGTQYRIYSAKQNYETLKMVVTYEKNIVGFNGPRMFRATKINPNSKNGYGGLDRIIESNQRSKLVQLNTAEPILKKGKFRMDFQKKVKIPSAKNFILECSSQKNEKQTKKCLLFGKIEQDTFIAQISYPLSILQAFGICLSSLDSKLMVN